MKKRIKRRNNIVMTMIIILLLVGGWNTYSWYHPNLYIKDFSLVSDDYNNIVEFVREYYSVNGNGKRMVLSVDSKDFTLTYNDMKVHMPEAVKESLKKICETSYEKRYDSIIISQKEVGFWILEGYPYAIIYTEDLQQTKESLDGFGDRPVRLARINSLWYELREELL